LGISGAISSIGLISYFLLSGRDHSNTAIQNEYDYIVVGGGSAGCAIATRLSEDQSKRVLLIEAGVDDNKLSIHMPLTCGLLQNTEVDWKYRVYDDPQTGDRVHFWPRGKVLGGSSSINYMVAVRGNKEDYNEWQKLGNEGWSYEDVLPYFKKIEDYPKGDPKYRGVNGPIHISDFTGEIIPITNLFVKGSNEYGLPENKDYNGESQIGVSLLQANIKDGLRQSTAVTYITQAEDRRNLHILTLAQVTKILIEDGKATGVIFQKLNFSKIRSLIGYAQVPPGPPQTVRARREIVISGGAIGSPQLLLLSGIGPREELESFGIECKVNLPGVGQNLQDHLCIFDRYVTDQKYSISKQDKNLKNVLQYYLFKSGVGTTTGVESNAFLKTETNKEKEKDIDPNGLRPDIQIHFISGLGNDDTSKNMNQLSFFGDNQGYDHGYIFAPTLLRPKSRGYVRLHTNNPFDQPIIQPNYLNHEEDFRSLMDAMEICKKISESPSMSKVTIKRLIDKSILYPSNSEEYLREYILRYCVTLYHPVGTCKMGPDSDPMAVVDSTLKVKGIKGLRVADASIMPTLICGNTNFPTIMIGEKVSDLIKLEHPPSKL